MTRRTLGILAGILLAIGVIAVVGVLAYQAGPNAGNAATGPYYGRGAMMVGGSRGLHFGFDAFGLGLGSGTWLLLLIGTVTVVGVVAYAVTRPTHLGGPTPGIPTPRAVPSDLQPWFEAWHRQAHGEPPSPSMTAPTSIANPASKA